MNLRTGTLLALLVLTSPAPASPTPRAATRVIQDLDRGIEFDVPTRLQLEAETDPPSWFWPSGNGYFFDIDLDDNPLGVLESPVAVRDTLYAYLLKTKGRRCDADGPDGGTEAGEPVSVERHHTPRGTDYIEYSLIIYDTQGARRVPLRRGPFWVAAIRARGKLLMLRLGNECTAPDHQTTARTARAIVNSLRVIPSGQ